MDRPRKDRQLKPSHLAYAFLGAFITAIFFLQWWQRGAYPMIVWLFLFILGLLCIIGLITFNNTAPGNGCCWVLIITLALTLALFTVARTTHVPNQNTIDWYAHNKPVAIRGIISDQPDLRQTSINYILSVTGLQKKGSNEAIRAAGKVLISDRRMWPRFSVGDDVMAEGSLTLPTATDNFAYDKYLSRFDIYTTLRFSKITLLRENQGNAVLRLLSGFREFFEAQINRVFPEPTASFLAGLLTGTQHGMPDHLLETFRETGLTHIVAISGFNITIIISIIGSLLFFLPLRWRFVPSIMAIILFTLFVGAGASVVRAAIMGILGLFALQTGRMRDARLAILWAAFFMLLWNPKTLWYDIGFQLSFLAVIGLTECGPLIKPWTQHLPKALGIQEAMEMTLAAQLFAVPWIVARFGLLSLVSPLANLLIAPLIPMAMLFGFLGTVTSFLFFPLGQLIGFFAWGLLELIILIATLLSHIPFASVTLPHIGPAFIVFYYVMLVGAIVWAKNRTPLTVGKKKLL